MAEDIVDCANRQLQDQIGALAQATFKWNGRYVDLIDTADEDELFCTIEAPLLTSLVQENIVADILRLLFRVRHQTLTATRRRTAHVDRGTDEDR